MKTSEIELGIYETYESIFGARATLEELILEIRRFSLQSVIWVCATVVTGMQLWDRNDPPYETYLELLKLFFPSQLQNRFLVGYWSSPMREVFHRRQLLLITKLAIEHCGSTGIDLRGNSQYFGSILLKASDQFHYGLVGGHYVSTFTKEDFAKIVADFSAVSEFGKANIGYQIVRNHLLLTRFTRGLNGHSDFVDAAAEFEQSSGLTLPEWEALVFMTHARFGRDLAAELKNQPGALPLNTRQYSKTAISDEKLGAFLREVSSRQSAMKKQIEERNYGTNDFTVFRQFPMIEQWYNTGTINQWVGYQLMDNYSLLEKQLAGPYWYAFRKNPERFPAFWGNVFEGYVNQLLFDSCSGTQSRFIPDVRHPFDHSLQICDGIVIDQDSVAIIECKGSIFSAATKYSGNHKLLADEIDKKLICEQDSGKRKKRAVIQLADAVKTLLKEPIVSESLHLDLTTVRKIYPLVVTLDGIGGTIGMSAFLNLAFADALEIDSIPRDKVSSLLCVDSGSLEYMTEYFHAKTLPQLLGVWCDFNESGAMPFAAVPIDRISRKPNVWLRAGYEEMFKSMVEVCSRTKTRKRRCGTFAFDGRDDCGA